MTRSIDRVSKHVKGCITVRKKRGVWLHTLRGRVIRCDKVHERLRERGCEIFSVERQRES